MCMTVKSFDIYRPLRWTTPLVFSSPHSGRDYSTSFQAKSRLELQKLRSSEDAFVDELYSAVPSFGAPLIAANAPRAFVDLNRNRDELDSAIIDGAPSARNNPRVASGLGVIPRVVAEGQVIMSGKLSMAEAESRLATFYDPYHAELRNLVEQSHRTFGQALLIDCHSMPHDALNNITVRGRRKPNIVLGDRFGATCEADVLDAVEEAFEAEGFAVSRNMPFAGASILRSYGRPAIRQNAIQVEIDRSLYMHERTITKRADFADIQASITRVIARMVHLGESNLPIAAE